MIKTIRRHHKRIAKASLEEENAKHDLVLDIPSSPCEAHKTSNAICNHLNLNIHISNATPTKAHHQQWNTEKGGRLKLVSDRLLPLSKKRARHYSVPLY